MRTAVFSTKSYDREFLTAANLMAAGQEAASPTARQELVFFEPRLTAETVKLAEGFPAICAFVNDQLGEPVLTALARGGTRLVALRSAGFNHVDLEAAARLKLTVVRVPAYSPYAVAEHTVGLMLCLNRKLHKAYARVREGNFALESLLGFDLRERTVGIIGTGKIGAIVARIVHGFGCRLVAHDMHANAEVAALGARYVTLDELFATADVISLHCPLTPRTHHLIDAAALAKMKRGVMLINTSRGALVDTQAVIVALKEGQVGYLGLDVYEEEGDLFFQDLSNQVIQDDVFSRLLTFPNVLVTAHQAFFTREALASIAQQTIGNLASFERGERPVNEVTVELVRR
jgi:D-lactate dehydrogenase